MAMIHEELRTIETFFKVDTKDSTVIVVRPTGSAYICNPPVHSTDLDFVVLVKSKEVFEKDFPSLTKSSEDYTGRESYFTSYRLHEYNFIVTDNIVWYYKFAAATELAKSLNLLDKEARIDLFETVIDDALDTKDSTNSDTYTWVTVAPSTTTITTTTTTGTSSDKTTINLDPYKHSINAWLSKIDTDMKEQWFKQMIKKP